MPNKIRASGPSNQDLAAQELDSLAPEARSFWKEKFKFSKETLGLSDKKAREWASRTVRVFMQGAPELLK
ncbi:MAG: hypothetical protein ACK4UN_08735 [Limisphaerales bacterium]